MMQEPAIAVRLDGVVVAFADTVLRFDAAIQGGGITAIVGASGSGKSTLLHLVAGFEAPDSGRIEILGRDMAAIEPAARPVSVIFQDHNLFAHLDVATNVGLGIDPALRLDAGQHAQIASALVDVGLPGFGTRLPPTLSGGERQRVALARALVRRRPVLLLDEPFAALDPGLREEMGQLLLSLQRRNDSTVLLVTHHAEDIRRLADRVVFLDQGRVVLEETSDVFLQRSAPEAVARFLGRPRP